MNIAALLDATPSGPVELYVQMREDKMPKLITDNLAPGEVVHAVNRFASIWAKTKKGRGLKPCPANGLEYFLCFSDGKVAGSIFVEPLPVVVTS